MQMSLRCGGDFTTNASVVDQISKRQDICLVSFKNPTTPLAFACESYIDTTFLFLNIFTLFATKLLTKAKGVSPVQSEKNT